MADVMKKIGRVVLVVLGIFIVLSIIGSLDEKYTATTLSGCSDEDLIEELFERYDDYELLEKLDVDKSEFEYYYLEKYYPEYDYNQAVQMALNDFAEDGFLELATYINTWHKWGVITNIEWNTEDYNYDSGEYYDFKSDKFRGVE